MKNNQIFYGLMIGLSCFGVVNAGSDTEVDVRQRKEAARIEAKNKKHYETVVKPVLAMPLGQLTTALLSNPSLFHEGEDITACIQRLARENNVEISYKWEDKAKNDEAYKVILASLRNKQ